MIEDRIRSIAARAAPLWDRRPADTLDRSASRAPIARVRLDRWRDIMGSAATLTTRLRSSDMPRPALGALLGGAQAEMPLPPWATILDGCCRAWTPSAPSDPTGDRAFDPAHPLPFEDVLVGVMRHARARLETELEGAPRVLAPAALVRLERQLLAHAAFVAGPTLGRHFYEFRFEQAPASAIESVWRAQPRSTHIYSAYVDRMRDGGLLALFDEYPVLARLLSQSVERWTRATTMFCRRFAEDFARLREAFGWTIDRPDGAVADVRPDLSDRHHGGQTVMDVSLRTGERIIYKPRTVRPEIAFYRLVASMNRRGSFPMLKVVQALDRTTHGWVEAIDGAACESGEEVERFYARMGRLLAILHTVAATDIHCENLIACGEHPVIVDLETLLSPRLTGKAGRVASVLTTGLLPVWQTAPDGRRFDMSALAADASQDPGVRFFAWQSINTDQMSFSEDARAEIATAHRVRLGDRLPTVADYLPALLQGFRDAYAQLLTSRSRLMSDTSLLAALDGLELRILVRGSATYAGMHIHLLHPELLKDGLDRSIELEWLARPLSGTRTPRKARQFVYEAERGAMENLDIPHFTTRTWMLEAPDDHELFRLGADRDARMFVRRLATFSARDLERQIAAIEDAVRSRYSEPPPTQERAASSVGSLV